VRWTIVAMSETAIRQRCENHERIAAQEFEEGLEELGLGRPGLAH
jgi:hypothetical protein